MENNIRNINLNLVYRDEKASLQLLESDNIGKLKHEINRLYRISPNKQVIDGWANTPNSDDDILQNCVQLDHVNNLIIGNIDDHFNWTDVNYSREDEEAEIEASISFISKIMNKYDSTTIQFHACKLQDAIKEACMLPPLEKRKALCLYLHNEKDKFSSTLCEYLRKPEVIEILNRNFFFLGFDIDEARYQSALTKALQRCHDLSALIPLVESKVSAAVCIVPIQDSVTIFSCIKGKMSNKDYLLALSNTESFLIVENQQEKNLEELKEKTGSENDIGSNNYQKLMADMLGDRDWDRFEFDQHEFLKKKIAFALLGPPQKEEGYEKKDIKKVQSLYESILKSNSDITKYSGRVEISFVYNCTEPLPSEKMSRAKKYKEYNPNIDVMPLPIFVLRKCRGSMDPCRVFIDNMGRTYQTWQEYITKNKFDQCEMILPFNGRYEVNENGEVLLERHLSPACGVDSKLLQGADYLSTAGGIVSGGIFIAAAIPTIAVAPAALIAGGVIGLGVGIYSMGRSAYTLYDRKKHKETLTFANSEARGAYLSIVAGSLGFVGVGATVAVSQLASLGVNIGQGAGAAIKTIGFVNIGASGMSMLNSSYDVIDHWIKENKIPSLLTIMQLKSSILFFGNIVHHTDSKDIDESQARTLQSYQESLRNNRLKKPFLILRKKTLDYKRKHDNKIVIVSPIIKIPHKDDVMAVLAVTNDAVGEKSVEFTITEDEQVKLNNQKIDIFEAVNIIERETSVFLSTYFPLSKLLPDDFNYVKEIISRTVPIILTNLEMEIFNNYVSKLLSSFNNDTKCTFINAIAFVLKQISSSIEQSLDEIFGDQSKYFHLVDVVICFYGKKCEEMKEQWKTWLSTRKEEFYIPFFEQIDEEELDVVQFFEKVVDMSSQGSQLTQETENELRKYFYNWFTQQVYYNQERLEREWSKQNNSLHSAEKINCTICGGYFYRICKKNKN